jgi:hypothetical protein
MYIYTTILLSYVHIYYYTTKLYTYILSTFRIPKQALQYKPKGRRNIGRPRKRWRDQFHFEDQGTGIKPNPS